MHSPLFILHLALFNFRPRHQNIDRAKLSQVGVPSSLIDRLYRALYIYSVGMYELFGSLATAVHDKSAKAAVCVDFLYAALPSPYCLFHKWLRLQFIFRSILECGKRS
jgi:hypothetical protein